MGFFDRNRQQLAQKGYDPSRLPPGQYLTDRFPVLHVGDVPEYQPGDWNLRVFGLVDTPFELTLDELKELPSVSLTFDIHCVTKWSKFDTTWKGVRVRDLFERAGVQAGATHVMEHAEFGYTTNVPLADITTDEAMVAYAFEGEEIEAIHGGPVRIVIPHLYSGSPPSGCAASNCARSTLRASGNATATACMATRSKVRMANGSPVTSPWMVLCSLTLVACTSTSGSVPTTTAIATTEADDSSSSSSGWTPPPVNAGFDYQLGGGYPPPTGVTVVTRDVTGSPAPGTYGICYVNAFQTQPGQRAEWPAGVVTDFEDPGFPDEYLVDISTVSKRERAAAYVATEIGTCATKGFSAVEFDNLDSWTRLDGTDREGMLPFGIEDTTDFARRLAVIAHGRGLAVGQKNTPQFGARRVAEVGFDFAVSEECAHFDECDRYQALYGDRIIDIEYDRDSFEAACESIGRSVSVVFRDVEVSPPGSATYMFETC